MIDRRRLFLIAVLAVAPAIAACGNITGNDDPPPSPPASDSTSFKDSRVWG